jgi:hypothetical protein
MVLLKRGQGAYAEVEEGVSSQFLREGFHQVFLLCFVVVVEERLFVLLTEGGDGGVEGVGRQDPDCLRAVDFVVVGFASVLVLTWRGMLAGSFMLRSGW